MMRLGCAFNYMGSAYQIFLGVDKTKHIFIDIDNSFYIYVDEADVDEYIQNCFVNECEHHTLLDVDFSMAKTYMTRLLNGTDLSFEELWLMHR